MTTTADLEWLPVFEEIAALPYYKPRFTLAILQALDADIDTKQRRLRIDPSDDCDAIADAPIAGLSAPTMILVRWEKKLDDLSDDVDAHLDACRRAGCIGLLVVAPLVVPELISSSSSFSNSRGSGAISTKVIGYAEVLELVKRHAAVVTRHVPHLTPLAVKERLREASRKSDDHWKQKRLGHLGTLRDAYTQDNLTLFLGAGVSIQAGLPTWRQLIDQLMVREVQRLYPKGLPLSAAKVASSARILSAFRGDNPLISARYIRKALGDEFIPILKEALYEHYDAARTSGLSRELAELCRPRIRRKGARAIVTYNFDDLVERELEALNVPNRTFCSEGDQNQDEALSVFHVHGLLRNDSTKDAMTVASSLDLTFSEERYHHLYTQAYSWSNLQQLFLLKNSTCLLIGFSMTDPNLRRLLEISAGRGQPPRHFAFLKRTLLNEAMTSEEKIPELSNQEVLVILSAHHEIQELAFEELGVNIIWIENYGEIEGFLKVIRAGQASA
jgi:hypothetical protein